MSASVKNIRQALIDGGTVGAELHPVAAQALKELDRLVYERDLLRVALDTIRTSRDVPSDGWKHYARVALRASRRSP